VCFMIGAMKCAWRCWGTAMMQLVVMERWLWWTEFIHLNQRQHVQQRTCPNLMCWWWLQTQVGRNEVKRNSWHWQKELDSEELDTHALSVTYGLWSFSSRSSVVAAWLEKMFGIIWICLWSFKLWNKIWHLRCLSFSTTHLPQTKDYC